MDITCHGIINIYVSVTENNPLPCIPPCVFFRKIPLRNILERRRYVSLMVQDFECVY